MTAIFFKPWIGDEYGMQSRFGKRVLVLGEAHYQWDEEIELWPDLTRTAIRDQISGERRHPFFTRVASAFLGHKPDLAEKKEFWSAVAFYNYIQKAASFGPRAAPSEQMWKEGEAGFTEVLRDLMPQVIIVLGYRLWARVSALGGTLDAPVDNAAQATTRRHPLQDGKNCLAYGIRHPSSGFTLSDWHPHILEVISRA